MTREARLLVRFSRLITRAKNLVSQLKGNFKISLRPLLNAHFFNFSISCIKMTFHLTIFLISKMETSMVKTAH